ncbi:MAG: leucyl aminopeptidase, partial [Pseudomonadales bacterium]|nr:leucyl aminopeptidase [Pseudomonadales bacterium]
MRINLTSADPSTLKTDCLVIGILADGKLTPSAQKADRANQGLIRRLVKDGDIQGNSGDTLVVPGLSSSTAKRLLLVGLGKTSKTGV